MSLFKRSNKNKSASATSTPAQTPRASVQTIRDSGIKMTPEEALYKISQNMMTNASNGPFLDTMSFSKRFNKNKSASAASTPVQSLRVFMQSARVSDT
ncbi:hypothetical protein BGX33_002019, partial [Mortierella sp. NVP41]